MVMGSLHHWAAFFWLHGSYLNKMLIAFPVIDKYKKFPPVIFAFCYKS